MLLSEIENFFTQKIDQVINIKSNSQKNLERIGLSTSKQLLFHKPYHYKIIKIEPLLSNIKIDTELIKTLKIVNINNLKKNRLPIKISCLADNRIVELIFFNKIAPFLFQRLQVGANITISGKIKIFQNTIQITHPEFIFKKHNIRELQPIYHLTYGLSNKQLYDYIFQTLKLLETIVKKENHPDQQNINNNIFKNKYLYCQTLISSLKALHYIELDNKKETSII